jgi:hypothetical protein
MTHAYKDHEPTECRFSETDDIEIRGEKYRWKSTDIEGHVLERRGSNCLERFSHSEMERLVQDDQVFIDLPDDFFAGEEEAK